MNVFYFAVDTNAQVRYARAWLTANFSEEAQDSMATFVVDRDGDCLTGCRSRLFTSFTLFNEQQPYKVETKGGRCCRRGSTHAMMEAMMKEKAKQLIFDESGWFQALTKERFREWLGNVMPGC